MINFQNKKNKRILLGVIVVILIFAMVVPMIASVLL